MNDDGLMYVFPVEGRIVRDPRTRQAVPREGMSVPREQHWMASLNFGDLIEGEKPADVTAEIPVEAESTV